MCFYFISRPADVPIPRLYQKFDANWKLGQDLSELTLDRLHCKKQRASFSRELATYILQTMPSVMKLEFPPQDTLVTEKFNNILRTRETIQVPANGLDTDLEKAFVAWMTGNTKSAGSIKTYNSHIFTSKYHFISLLDVLFVFLF